jgi:hypothetical protein
MWKTRVGVEVGSQKNCVAAVTPCEGPGWPIYESSAQPVFLLRLRLAVQ